MSSSPFELDIFLQQMGDPLVRSLQLYFLTRVDIAFIRKRVVTALPCTDSDHFLDRVNKDDPVADIPCSCRSLNGFDGLFHVMVTQDNVELNARQEIHSIRSDPPRQLDASLAAMPAHFYYIHPDNPHLIERLLHSSQFFFTKDSLNFLGHVLTPWQRSGVRPFSMFADIESHFFFVLGNT